MRSATSKVCVSTPNQSTIALAAEFVCMSSGASSNNVTDPLRCSYWHDVASGAADADSSASVVRSSDATSVPTSNATKLAFRLAVHSVRLAAPNSIATAKGIFGGVTTAFPAAIIPTSEPIDVCTPQAFTVAKIPVVPRYCGDQSAPAGSWGTRIRNSGVHHLPTA